MAPLPEQESDKEMVGDFVKALLDELEIDFWALGSTTFKSALMLEGIEPGQCFYIECDAVVSVPNSDRTLIDSRFKDRDRRTHFARLQHHRGASHKLEQHRYTPDRGSFCS